MKKLVVLLTAIVLASCASNEEKASRLIDREMFKTLLDYESYEPIETIVTEASTSVYTDSLIRGYAMASEALSSLVTESNDNAQDALDYMKIYADSYSYSYSGRQKYDEYKETAEEAIRKSETYLGLWKQYADSLNTSMAEFTPTHAGWEVKHKFRCKSKGGNPMIADYIYIMDDKFSKIISHYDMDDEDEKKIREVIKSVLDSAQSTTQE